MGVNQPGDGVAAFPVNDFLRFKPRVRVDGDDPLTLDVDVRRVNLAGVHIDELHILDLDVADMAAEAGLDGVFDLFECSHSESPSENLDNISVSYPARLDKSRKSLQIVLTFL